MPAKPINIVLTIRDGKTPKPRYAQMLINVVNQDGEPDIFKQIEMARRFQLDIDAQTTGQIVACGLIVDVPLDPSLKIAPDPNSDSEEGATFVFKSDGGYLTTFRIPTFDQTKILPNSADVDLLDADVSEMIMNIIVGYDSDPLGGGDYLDVQDSRGDDVFEFVSAKQSFQKSRV
jgi:hypothetical protein